MAYPVTWLSDRKFDNSNSFFDLKNLEGDKYI